MRPLGQQPLGITFSNQQMLKTFSIDAFSNLCFRCPPHDVQPFVQIEFIQPRLGMAKTTSSSRSKRAAATIIISGDE